MLRFTLPRLCVLAMAAMAVSLAGCGTRPPDWLSPIFEEPAAKGKNQVADAGTRRPRRPPYKVPAPAEAPPEVVALPDWTGLYRTLPRNDDGEVQWVKAVADKLIEPKAGIEADAKGDEPTDMDVELVPKGQPEFKVVFSHKVHTTWMACDSCHAGLFEMEHGKTVITMDKINAGASCGVCHGKVAAPGPTACPACHKAMG